MQERCKHKVQVLVRDRGKPATNENNGGENERQTCRKFRRIRNDSHFAVSQRAPTGLSACARTPGSRWRLIRSKSLKISRESRNTFRNNFRRKQRANCLQSLLVRLPPCQTLNWGTKGNHGFKRRSFSSEAALANQDTSRIQATQQEDDAEARRRTTGFVSANRVVDTAAAGPTVATGRDRCLTNFCASVTRIDMANSTLCISSGLCSRYPA